MTRIVDHFLTGAVAALAIGPLAAAPAAARDGPSESGRGIRAGRVEIRPYIEAAQVISSELSPDSDTVTYSRIAVGADATIHGRNNQGAVSLRYERRIGWSKDAPDGDLISGIARISAAIVPQTLSFEAGGLATRARIEGNGGAVISPLDGGSSSSDLYSVYGGPSLRTHAGDVAISADYRIGYSRVDAPNGIVTAPGAEPVDVFDDSLVNSATVHAGIKPGVVLPVGIGVGAAWNREDISNLDQRMDDRNVRADVTYPLTPSVALVGGIGYEEVKLSNRDARRDAAGNPLIGKDGRYLIDKSGPRQISYDIDGIIWDAGVVWRPSNRTALEAHYGHRYGGATYYGSFAWQPNHRSNINVSVYDNIGGIGGRLNNALVSLPTEFTANRNPLTGDLGNCVIGSGQPAAGQSGPGQGASGQGGACFGSALGSVRSAMFRSRGVMATYSLDLGRLQTGVGVGYDRRTFKAARGTVLGTASGVVDENIWLAAYLNGRLDERSSFSANIYANRFESGFDLAGSATAFGATAAYNRLITNRLTATAAVGIDGVNRKIVEDELSASALVGMRYSF